MDSELHMRCSQAKAGVQIIKHTAIKVSQHLIPECYTPQTCLIHTSMWQCYYREFKQQRLVTFDLLLPPSDMYLTVPMEKSPKYIVDMIETLSLYIKVTSVYTIFKSGQYYMCDIERDVQHVQLYML